MSDWPTIEQDLHHLLDVARRWPGGLSGTHAGHPLRVAHVSGEVEWIVVHAWVCRQHEMDPVLVLERNGQLAYASLALLNGDYWLRMAVPLDSAAADDRARFVSRCVDAARALSPVRVAPAGGGGDLFSHYTD